MRALAIVLLACALGLVAATTSLPRSAATAVRCDPDLPRERSPIAARDGRTLSWSRIGRRTSVFVSAADGSGATSVAVPGRGKDRPVALAPDGSRVLIEREGSPDRLILAATRGSDSRFVTESEATEVRRGWRTPEWSPDGRFRVETGPIGDGVWIVPAEGGSRRPIAGLTSSYGATWSPDGGLIAFTSSHATSGALADLYVVRPDGTGLRALTRFGYGAEGPSWSPDGSLIAFAVDHTAYHEGSGIALIRPDGSGLRVVRRAWVAPDRRSSGEVSWLGSKRLLFVSWQWRQYARVVDVHTSRSDGRGERRITYQCHLGWNGDEIFRGSNLGDTIRTFGGNDDVRPGPGRDDVDVGAGADLVRSADWARDLVRCGRGRDRVIADRRDRVAHDCEQVVRWLEPPR